MNDTSPEEIAQIIRRMKNKTSSGYDGISNVILQCCSPMVKEHLYKAFNECLKIGSFPECPEIAKVIALPKKGDYINPETTVRLVY